MIISDFFLLIQNIFCTFVPKYNYFIINPT